MSYASSRRFALAALGTGLAATALAAPAAAAAQHSPAATAHKPTSITRAHVASAASSGGVSLSGAPGGGSATGGSHLGDRTLRKGMRGRDVRVLQDFLTRAGFDTPVMGVFGPLTARNVKAFERAHKLRDDGVLTPSVALVLRQAVAKALGSTAGPVGRARLNADGTASAPAGAPALISRVIAAANRIAFKPYIYGGGHASWSDSGYDCSGSVSYALHGASLISAPEDSGELESYGSAGRGRWITIYANSGHTYMLVAGLRFDTSAQDSTGGSRWTDAARSSDGYVVRHPTGL